MKINKKVFAVIFIAATLLRLAVYFFMQSSDGSDSYDKYLSGEYFFRAQARTVLNADTLDTSLDLSDPKVFLSLQNGAKVYAFDPKGDYCTVVNGKDVITDYPISKLVFDTDEEKKIFYGTLKYSKEEYEKRLKSLKEDSPVLSDPSMIEENRSGGFRKLFLVSVLASCVVMAFLLFISAGRDGDFSVLIAVWTILCILWNIVSLFVLK